MKTSRKIFRWIIVFAMFLTIMAPVFAATDYGITWDISEEGVLTVSCGGELKQKPWMDQAEKVKKIVISEGVTSLGDYVFKECVNLEEVVLPESLVHIYNHVFPLSPNFREIYIPAGVGRINYSAFFICNALERIVVSPDNPHYTSDDRGVLFNKDMSFLLFAPNGMTGSYTVPDTVRQIGGEYYHFFKAEDSYSKINVLDTYSPFQNCEKLTQILIPDSVEHIGQGAFKGCYGLTEVTIPDSVRTLGGGAFGGCINLTKVNIGSGVKSIGQGCFSNCKALPEITIPSNVFEIGQGAFRECKALEKVIIEDGINKIGQSAFLFCDNLKELRLPSTLTKITDDMVRNCISLKSVTIPRGVTRIGAHAFDGCTVLRDVTFEGEAPTFGEVAFIEKGLYFHYPEGMESWEAIVGTKPGIQASIKWVPYTLGEFPELPLYSLDWYKYEIASEGLYMEWDLTSDGVLTFRGTFDFVDRNFQYDGPRDSVKKIVIGEGVKIVNGLGGMPLLEEVVLPEGLRYISGSCFSNCPKLKRIQIPKSVVYMDPRAFEQCENLERIDVVPGNRSYTSDEYGVVYNKDMTILLMTPLGLSGTYQIPDGVQSVGGTVNYSYLQDGDRSYGLVSYYGFRDCGKLTGICFNEDLVSIEKSAFENCSSLREVTLPESVKSLGEYAFRNCDSLNNMTIGSGIKSISRGCFRECDGLTEIRIPGTVETIEVESFWECTGLQRLIMEDGVTKIARDAVVGCTGLKELRLPATVTVLDTYFRNCDGLESVTIPATVTQISYQVFYYCENLKEVTFEGNWPEINSMAFPEKELTFYYPQGDETWEKGLAEKLWLCSTVTWVPYELHNWVEATCDTARVCADCGLVSGEPLGHDWQEVTCLTPKTCTRCGLMEGEALGHSWKEATCTAPKTCDHCGLREGEALGHNFAEEVCTRCGKPDIPGIMGDVDGNGKLDYNDALIVLRSSVKLATLTPDQEVLADFDGNGVLNYNDALAILRASIGL